MLRNDPVVPNPPSSIIIIPNNIVLIDLKLILFTSFLFNFPVTFILKVIYKTFLLRVYAYIIKILAAVGVVVIWVVNKKVKQRAVVKG